MTFHRLLLREIAVPLVLSMLLVGQLLVVLQLLQLNEVLFGSGFDPWSVLRTAIYLAPHFGVIAVPLAFLLAVMLGLGRLAEDNELVAFGALGRSPKALYLVPVLLSVVLGFIVAGLAFEGEPWGLRGIHRELNELIKRNVAGDIKPGTFFEDIPRFTVFVGRAHEGDGRWEHVLLHDSVGDGTPFFVLARGGRVESSGASAALRLDLADGELHRAASDGDYTRARFEEASVALGVSDVFNRRNKFNRPAGELELFQMPKAAAEARAAGDHAAVRRIETEFHVRIAACLSCLIFGLIAVPLAAGSRSARTRSFVATVVAFATYYVVQTIGKGLGETGALPPMVGAWIPNAIGLVVAAVLGWRLRRGAGAMA